MHLLAVSASTTAALSASLEVPVWGWVAFCGATAVLLMLDMFVFHRHAHEPTLRESALWTVFWIVLAILFNGWVWRWAGTQHGLEFLMGYLLEKALSMDNVFVFMVIFAFFGVPLKYQYRVLFWGIFGAIVMRLIFILAANEIIRRFDWVLYLFGAFLIYTGYKLARSHGADTHPDQNIVLRFARRHLRVAEGTHGEHFFVHQDGRRYVTSLFLVLLVIESTDVVFAIDSVPAIFVITKEPFIVFTSNIFAIMGLRALYFLLAGVIGLFRYLHYGLSAILIFIGVKQILHDFWHPPHWLSLGVIVTLLGASIGASLVAARRELAEAIERADEPVKMPPDLPSQHEAEATARDDTASAQTSHHT